MLKVSLELTDRGQALRMAAALDEPMKQARRRMLDATTQEDTQEAFEVYHALRRVTTALYTAIHTHDAHAVRDDSPTLRERRRFR